MSSYISAEQRVPKDPPLAMHVIADSANKSWGSVLYTGAVSDLMEQVDYTSRSAGSSDEHRRSGVGHKDFH
jgi:hypothetical protein